MGKKKPEVEVLPKARVAEVKDHGVYIETKQYGYGYEVMSPTWFSIEEAEQFRDDLDAQIARAKRVRWALTSE